jgi:heat-inducible transcriptional repressor
MTTHDEGSKKRPEDLAIVGALSERARTVLRHIVDDYVQTGEPVGSRTISRKLGLGLSPATIRNVMADLEDIGLLYAPHTSAGRLPTDIGLRLFVNGLLEWGNLTREERDHIESQCGAAGKSLSEALSAATNLLSDLSHCAGLVVVPQLNETLKHVEFLSLGPGRALMVAVTVSGAVENRVIDVPIGMPPSSLVEASNYLSARLAGRSLSQARGEIAEDMKAVRATLDKLSRRVVEQGLATWSEDSRGGVLIVRGQAQLLEDVTGLEDLERIRQLFTMLETKETLVKLIDLADTAQGVQIFIGAENELFALAGCSAVIAPYKNSQKEIVGAIGVVGPTRIDYARIIPMVDFTAQVVGRMLG